MLADAGVEFILVGGLAAITHGSARLTQDVDVVYVRHGGDLDRLSKILAPHKPYLRPRPDSLSGGVP